MVTVKPVGGIHSYEMREDDWPPITVFYFDAVVEIGDETYRCDFDSYDFSPEEWVAEVFPKMDYGERQKLSHEVWKAFKWVIDERGRW